MSNVKRSWKHGINVASTTNPVGDNYAANFIRGFTLYYTDDEAKAQRMAKIDEDRQAAHDYLMSK